MSWIEVVNPASGEVLGEVATFGEQGVDEAVATTREAK
jgi:acyl-CoA reductase-like NAD-dependent aldehyde dehydrogenase